MKQKVDLSPIDQEVLDNVVGYDVRQFRGIKGWSSEVVDDLQSARQLQTQLGPRTLIYAIGRMPSRSGQIGYCHVS